MRNRRHIAFAGAATAAMLLAAGCGSPKEETTQQTSAVQPAGAGDTYGNNGYGDDGNDSAPQGGSSKTGPAKELAVRDVPELGDVVTDSKGFTLYRFEEDSAKPPTTTCEGPCAGAWPPVPADDATASDGIDDKLLGEVTRADGSKQLTLAGWPVYRYAQDTVAGDTKGHGVNGTWNALSPTGAPAGQKAEQEEEEPETTVEDTIALAAVEDADLGTIVVDGKRRTLYRFDKDTAWPMKSNCTGKCLETWKPAKMVDKNDVKGINPDLISAYKRADGTEQLSIDCWPVYWFTGDEEPGDTNGHGKQGLWWAVTPHGKKAKSGS